MHNIEKTYQLLLRVNKILSEVDKLAQSYGHPKKSYIRQLYRDCLYYIDELKEELDKC